jgi:hypothetical protein
LDEATQHARREQQAALYGAPLSETVRRLTDTLGLTQAGVARVLGVSAPMLSQLVTGQRIKIGNPVAVQRLVSLLGLVDEVERGLAHDRLASRLEEIGSDSTPTLTRPAASPQPAARQVSRVLQAVASGRELAAAAAALQDAHPDLAEVLRVYGLGAPEDAERHFASLGLPPDR